MAFDMNKNGRDSLDIQHLSTFTAILINNI